MADFDEHARLLSDTSQSAFRRTDALRAVVRSGDERVPLLLMSVLGDGERQVRREAVKALGRLGGGRAVPAIVAALETEEDREARRAMVVTLGELADPRAVEVLQDLVDGSSSGLKYAARDALRKIQNATPEPVEPERQEEPGDADAAEVSEPPPVPAAPADEQPEREDTPPEPSKGLAARTADGRPRPGMRAVPPPLGRASGTPPGLEGLRLRAARERPRAGPPPVSAAPPDSNRPRLVTCGCALVLGLLVGVFLLLFSVRGSRRPSRRRPRPRTTTPVQIQERPARPRAPRPPAEPMPLATPDVTTPEGVAVYQQCDQAIKARQTLATDGNGLGADMALVALYLDVDEAAGAPVPSSGTLAHYHCTRACARTKAQRVPLRSVQVIAEHVHAKQGSENRHIAISGVPGYRKLVLHVELERGKAVNLGRLVLKKAE